MDLSTWIAQAVSKLPCKKKRATNDYWEKRPLLELKEGAPDKEGSAHAVASKFKCRWPSIKSIRSIKSLLSIKSSKQPKEDPIWPGFHIANPKHLKILRDTSDVWNKYRDERIWTYLATPLSQHSKEEGRVIVLMFSAAYAYFRKSWALTMGRPETAAHVVIPMSWDMACLDLPRAYGRHRVLGEGRGCGVVAGIGGGEEGVEWGGAGVLKGVDVVEGVGGVKDVMREI